MSLGNREVKRPRTGLPAGFGVLWITVATDLVGFGIVFPLLPLYAKHFQASPAVIGAVVASFSAAQVIFAPLLGRLSDRYGRKRVIVLSMIGTALASVATGLAPSLWVLFAARILDGASGSSVAVARASVADVTEPGDRARLFGLLSAAFGVGFVIGPALGALAALGGERLPFLVAGVVAGVNACIAAWKLTETRHANDVQPIHEDRMQATAVQSGRNRLLWWLAVSFLLTVAFSGFETTLPLFVNGRFGTGLAGIGVIFTAVGIVIVCVQVGLIKRVVRALGEPSGIRVGLSCVLLGLVVLSQAHSLVGVACAVGALALGQALTAPILAAVISACRSAGASGGVLGTQQGIVSLARTAGPLAGGVVFAVLGASGSYLVAAALVGVALVAAAGRRDRRLSPDG